MLVKTLKYILEKEISLTLCYFLIVVGIGLFTQIFNLNKFESFLLSQFQSMIFAVVPIQIFFIITFLGDIRFWIVVSIIYFAYTYFRLKKLNGAIELIAFLAIVTFSAYFLKEIFRRERPCTWSSDVIAYTNDSDFSYPSGHVSRSLGAYHILFREFKISNLIPFLLITLISLSRIVLGVHYITDIIGAIFLSLFSEKVTNIALNIINRRLGLLQKM